VVDVYQDNIKAVPGELDNARCIRINRQKSKSEENGRNGSLASQ
jgi:hypothetical protein